MKFDAEYYNRLHQFFNQKDDVRYKISDLSDDPEKFIFHTKYYIDNRRGDDSEVEFNSITETEIMYGVTYTEIRVLEFFESKIKEREKLIRKIVNKFDLFEPKKPYTPPAAVPKTEPAKKEEPKKIIPPGYKTPGLFQ